MHTDTATELAALDEIDAAETHLADRADAVAEVRARLAEVTRRMHELSRELLADDYEQVLAASYELTDAATELTSLRFRLELAL